MYYMDIRLKIWYNFLTEIRTMLEKAYGYND